MFLFRTYLVWIFAMYHLYWLS